MTVDRLRRSMSSEEFVRWGIYFARKSQRQELEIARAKAAATGK